MAPAAQINGHPSGPPGNVSNRTVLVVIPVIFYTLGLVFYGLRIHTRRVMKKLAIDDAMMTVSIVFATGFFCAYFVSYANGLGKHYMEVPRHQITAFAKATFIALPETYSIAIASVRLSIGFMLMRIKGGSPVWRWGLWAIMLVVCVVFVMNTVITFVKCRPLSTYWTLDYAHATCLSNELVLDMYLAFNVVYLATDFLFALLPVLFIRKLNQPLRDRIVLGLLMAMGLSCAAANIPRIILTVSQNNFKDFTYDAAGTVFWCSVELYIAIIAASIPILRHRFEAGLQLLGFSISSSSAKSSDSRKPETPSPSATPLSTYRGQAENSRSGSQGSDMDMSLLKLPKLDLSWLDLEDLWLTE